MKLTKAGTILFVIQISILGSHSQAAMEINVDAVVLQGMREGCPPDTVRALADFRTKVQDLVSEMVELRMRVCECGYGGAGWKRVAFLNMTNTDQTCPGEWQLVTSPRRTCRRSHNYACSLASFYTEVSYSEVCGRLVGYQYGSTDALWNPINVRTTPDNASSTQTLYDGGVLISHGTAPRQHIWSLVSGNSQQTVHDNFGCPCNVGSTVNQQDIPSWLGQDYFCDSATTGTQSQDYIFYSDNPLWDGVGCDESITTCCQFNNPPWFCKQLPQPTSDNIELRLCADSPTEGTPIELVEIYVR